MGASVRPREFDVDQPSQTEQLSNWINLVRTKKLICRRSRKRNLRVEAVLTSVLSKAEDELRNKQISRILRWQEMKERMLESKASKDGGDEDCRKNSANDNYNDIYSLCPELRSLDSFMTELSQIKVPVQR